MDIVLLLVLRGSFFCELVEYVEVLFICDLFGDMGFFEKVVDDVGIDWFIC